MKYSILVMVLASFSCGTPSSDTSLSEAIPYINEREFTVAHAPEWSNLFLRKSGWLGGDGIFAIPLSGVDSEEVDSVLFLFSDTMVGEIEGDNQPGQDHPWVSQRQTHGSGCPCQVVLKNYTFHIISIKSKGMFGRPAHMAYSNRPPPTSRPTPGRVSLAHVQPGPTRGRARAMYLPWTFQKKTGCA